MWSRGRSSIKHIISVLFLLFCFLLPTLNAEPINYEWTTKASGKSGEWQKDINSSHSVFRDISGNVYFTSVFYDTVDFNPGEEKDLHTTNRLQGSVFLTKYNSFGEYQWTRSFGGQDLQEWTPLPTISGDSMGGVYVAGVFDGTAIFSDGSVEDSKTSNGDIDIFLTKFDSTGDLLWTRTFGGPDGDAIYGMRLSVDSSGNVILAGTFEGSVDLDPGVATVEKTSVGYQDVFLSKFDSNGNFLWSSQRGSAFQDQVFAIATDEEDSIYVIRKELGHLLTKFNSAGVELWQMTYSVIPINMLVSDFNGNLYVSGRFSGAYDFDPGPGQDIKTIQGNGIFVSKISALGNYQWTIISQGPGYYNRPSSIAANTVGVFLTGEFSDIIDCDPGPGVANLSSSVQSDTFLAHYDSNGQYQWAHKLSTQVDYHNGGFHVLTNPLGGVSWIGSFARHIDFDFGVNTHTKRSLGNTDLFHASYDASGNFESLWTIPGSGEMWGSGTAADNNGIIYVVGGFEGTVDFDPGPNEANLTSVELSFTAYLSRYSSAGNFISVTPLWHTSASKGGNKVADGGGITTLCCGLLAVDESGNTYIGGVFSGTVDFNPAMAEDIHTSAGDYDIFVAKFASDGSYQWTVSIGGSGYDGLESMTIERNEKLVLQGVYSDTVDFDPGAGVDKRTASEQGDMFTTALSLSGSYLSTRSSSYISEDITINVVRLSNSAYYEGGSFNGTVECDPPLSTDTELCEDDYGVAISKFDYEGQSPLWVRKIGNQGAGAYLSDMVVDSDESVYAILGFVGTIDLDPGVGTSWMESDYWGYSLIKLDREGNFKWANFLGTHSDYRASISIDNTGNLFLVSNGAEDISDQFINGTPDAMLGSDQWEYVLSVQKISREGDWLWNWSGAYPGASPSDNYGYFQWSVLDVKRGIFLLTGGFEEPIDFDSSANTNLLINSGADAFIT